MGKDKFSGKKSLVMMFSICAVTLATISTGSTVYVKAKEKVDIPTEEYSKDSKVTVVKDGDGGSKESENSNKENTSHIELAKDDTKVEIVSSTKNNVDSKLLDEVDKQVSNELNKESTDKDNAEDNSKKEEKSEEVKIEEIEYTVKSGDTLDKIVKANNTVLSNVQNLNNISNPKQISVGQVLKIRKNDKEEKEIPVEKVEDKTTDNSKVENTEDTSNNETNVSTPETTSEAKEWIAQKESGGNYNARNGQYIGRYQLTDSYLNGDYSVENQERVAEQYVSSRYGTWENAKQFWLSNGWY